MKRLVSALLPLFFVLNLFGQVGNEWVRYNQPYFKIPVGQDGFYKITPAALHQAGLPATADPRTFQLFFRGVEQAILVKGENDGLFNTGDLIEFYGRKNDGALDSTLYTDPDHQPHKLYNLYSDSTAYFLTYGSSMGKRIETFSAPSAGVTEQKFHWAEKILILRNFYSAGFDYGNVFKSAFDSGEGWMSTQIIQGQESSFTLEGLTDGVAAHGKPFVEMVIIGRGAMSHNVQISAGNRVLSTVAFAGVQSQKFTHPLEWSDIDNDGKITIRVRVTGSAGNDRVSVGYVRVLFPQLITMSGSNERTFSLDATAHDRVSVRVQAPGSGLRLFDITDASALVEISGHLTTTLEAVIPHATTRRRILAMKESRSVSRITRVTFRSMHPATFNYLIITHRALRKPALGYVDPVKAFAEFRSLPERGGFDTLVVNIDQLYDQFNYGETSPRAIYQFMKYCASVKLPDYLFLVGKGLDVNYGYHRNPSAFPVYKDLVPTAGYPASDMAFTAGLGGTPNVPAVATGRLSATTAADVAAYLNKVKVREALPFDELNRKKILHLSGGIEEHEPALFRQILKSYEVVAEDLYLGGRVQAIAKQSTDIKLINIADEVNKGLGLITFFGHSAPNTLDFDIGLVTDPVMGYNNTGKYPFLLMNGCDAGSFFLNTTIPGENWTTTPDKGAVGFIAHSSYGLVSGLQGYSSVFYEVAFGDSVFVKEGIGKVQQEVARRFLDMYGSSPMALSQSQQMVLLGDPALVIFGAQKPDYSPVPEAIFITSFDKEPVTALVDSFLMRIPVRNFGIAHDKNIRLNVMRQYSSGQASEYDIVIPSVLYEDTLSITIKNLDRNGYGINTFKIKIDADDAVDELNEDNNIATFEYFIPLNSTRNLFPYNYGIVQQRDIHLSFQFTDLLGPARDYLLEIDTTDTFDSGFKQTFRIHTQVLGRQAVNLLDRDSTAYYWRTRIAEPLENESQLWTMSSFTYIANGPEGWAQIHFPQFKNNENTGLVRDPELRRMQFSETVSDIAIKTFSSAAGKPLDSISFKVNGVELNLLYEGGACRNNTINLVAFDRRSTQPYAGIYFKWYELLYEYGGRKLLCGREPYVINSFRPAELATGSNDDLIRYIDNIHAGDSVVLFSIGNAGYAQWPAAARTKLGELGVSTAQLSGLANGDPVVIFGRKGSAPGTANIHDADTRLEVSGTIAGRFTSGVMSSPAIGPAQRWDKFLPFTREKEETDNLSFALVGIKPDGERDTLRTNVSGELDLSFINPSMYPQLQVVFKTGDDINLTAVQLKKWIVLYEPVADGLTFYSGPLSQETLQEGAGVVRNFGFVNVTDKEFPDSLSVRVRLANAANPDPPVDLTIASPLPGDTTLFSVFFDTMGKAGLNDVEVFVNPHVVPEADYDNNFIQIKEHLRVLIDEAGPVIDVTFDGRHLYNEEYVSANPDIAIRLWDENPFMLRSDTLGMKIFLAYPCASDKCEFTPLYFSRDDVTWAAATDASEFEVHLAPRDLPEGRYVLRVEARDVRGNTNGDLPYEIVFQVTHVESMTVSAAYPNPFFLESNIDVLLTNERESPTFYQLLITTVSGRIVWEATNTGGLHVGLNKIRWRGEDRAGQSLPNGIYFYRLIITRENRHSEYNGKIVLLR